MQGSVGGNGNGGRGGGANKPPENPEKRYLSTQLRKKMRKEEEVKKKEEEDRRRSSLRRVMAAGKMENTPRNPNASPKGSVVERIPTSMEKTAIQNCLKSRAPFEGGTYGGKEWGDFLAQQAWFKDIPSEDSVPKEKGEDYFVYTERGGDGIAVMIRHNWKTQTAALQDVNERSPTPQNALDFEEEYELLVQCTKEH